MRAVDEAMRQAEDEFEADTYLSAAVFCWFGLPANVLLEGRLHRGSMPSLPHACHIHSPSLHIHSPSRGEMLSWRRSTGVWLRGRRQVVKALTADASGRSQTPRRVLQSCTTRCKRMRRAWSPRAWSSTRATRPNGGCSACEQRVRRLSILLSYGVSSKTGHCLEKLREALAALMKDQRLFPKVGMSKKIKALPS